MEPVMECALCGNPIEEGDLYAPIRRRGSTPPHMADVTDDRVLAHVSADGWCAR